MKTNAFNPTRQTGPASKFLAAKLAFTLVFFCITLPLQAGQLNKFEQDVQENAKKQENENTSEASECDDNCSSFFWEVTKLLFNMTKFGFSSSLAQVNPAMNASWAAESSIDEEGNPVSPEDDWFSQIDMRKPGSPLIPFVRLDLDYQYIAKDLDAFNYQIEVGYGPFALHYARANFSESDPDDSLHFTQIFGLFRLAYASVVEIDIGFGKGILEGDSRHEGFGLTLPVRILPSENYGLEFRPTWVASLSEYDLALSRDLPYSSIKLGYRWLNSKNESLNGPYLGVSLRY